MSHRHGEEGRHGDGWEGVLRGEADPRGARGRGREGRLVLVTISDVGFEISLGKVATPTPLVVVPGNTDRQRQGSRYSCLAPPSPPPPPLTSLLRGCRCRRCPWTPPRRSVPSPCSEDTPPQPSWHSLGRRHDDNASAYYKQTQQMTTPPHDSAIILYTVEPPNNRHSGDSSPVHCKRLSPSRRLSASQSVHYWRFHCV